MSFEQPSSLCYLSSCLVSLEWPRDRQGGSASARCHVEISKAKRALTGAVVVVICGQETDVQTKDKTDLKNFTTRTQADRQTGRQVDTLESAARIDVTNCPGDRYQEGGREVQQLTDKLKTKRHSFKADKCSRTPLTTGSVLHEHYLEALHCLAQRFFVFYLFFAHLSSPESAPHTQIRTKNRTALCAYTGSGSQVCAILNLILVRLQVATWIYLEANDDHHQCSLPL